MNKLPVAEAVINNLRIPIAIQKNQVFCLDLVLGSSSVAITNPSAISLRAVTPSLLRDFTKGSAPSISRLARSEATETKAKRFSIKSRQSSIDTLAIKMTSQKCTGTNKKPLLIATANVSESQPQTSV